MKSTKNKLKVSVIVSKLEKDERHLESFSHSVNSDNRITIVNHTSLIKCTEYRKFSNSHSLYIKFKLFC